MEFTWENLVKFLEWCNHHGVDAPFVDASEEPGYVMIDGDIAREDFDAWMKDQRS